MKLNNEIKMRCCLGVTEPTRCEVYGSMCKFLFINIVNTQAGSNNGKQIWHGQDTRVILGQVNNIQQGEAER